jgi:U3 small nucleolar RNA-associated protein 20
MYMHLYINFLQDEIISKLKERLLVKHSLAYEPLLDLLVQFARDIQSEFYPYFKEMFPILVGMCDCQDADLIQVY